MAINKISETDILMIEAYGRLNDYQQAATKSAIYPGRGSAVGLMYVALKLNGEAGELAEHVGKAMRDDNWFGVFDDEEGALDEGVSHAWERPLTNERKELLIKEVGDVLWYLSAICNELDISLMHAARCNLLKLQDRQARKALQGSGDER